uniref:ATPase AAA-type core domain-containing protein n=1 Tax=Anopheles minimus TaxID=112268 RepID=A0A182W226_9DIPT
MHEDGKEVKQHQITKVLLLRTDDYQGNLELTDGEEANHDSEVDLLGQLNKLKLNDVIAEQEAKLANGGDDKTEVSLNLSDKNVPHVSLTGKVPVKLRNDIVTAFNNPSGKSKDDYERSLVRVKEEINVKQGAAMTEDIADEIRTWFREYQKRTGRLPDFPSVRGRRFEASAKSPRIRNFGPCIKSLLIAGPKGSGKTSLVHVICTETSSVLFDISPPNIVSKYPGKSGLIMLMHLISKVSRLLQPSVIYFGDAEKSFMKKINKTDRTDPKRLKKDLPKLVKNIQPEDRIMLIGPSDCPWEADMKLMVQAYQRFIYITRPDYGALSYAWKELLSHYSGVHRQFDTGAMAKISAGYTIGSVVRCIREMITCKRMLQLRVHPLTHLALEPMYKEEEEAFLYWWCKTPLVRRRSKQMEKDHEAMMEMENIYAEILALQQHKLGIADGVLTGTVNKGSKLTMDDFKLMFVL